MSRDLLERPSSPLGWVRWALLRDHSLRAGWRFHLHLAMGLLGLVVSALLMLLVIGVWTYVGSAMPGSLALLGVQAAVTFVVFVVLHVVSALVLDATWGGDRWFRVGSLVGVGLGGPLLRSALELAAGVALGVGGILPALGVMYIAGVHMQLAPLTVELVGGFLLMSVVLFAAAAFEELAFRGYAWLWLGASLSRLLAWVLGQLGARGDGTRRVAHWVGFAVPTLLISAVFGLAHATNPSATVLSSVNTVLAGLWLAVLILRTRSLWAAIGAHWSWNHFHGLVLGFPLSGLSEDMPSLLQSRGMQPDWLGGGEYGVEGSVGATLSCVLLLVVCALLPRRAVDQAHVALVIPARPEGDGGG